MADRDFQINVRIDGEAGPFESALGDAETAVREFKKELNDMNGAILGATRNIRSVRDNARGLATDMGYAERALESMTKRVREVRDDAIQLSGAMRFGAEAVNAMGVASDDLTNAQAELVSTIDRVNKSLGDQLLKLEGTLIGADMLQRTMRDLAAAEEEARIAADGEADAIDRVGDAAMTAAEKIQLANGLSRDQLSLFDKLSAKRGFDKQGSFDFIPVGAKPVQTVTSPAYNAAAIRAEMEQLSLLGTEAMKAGTQLALFDDKNRQIAFSGPAVDAVLASETSAINELGDAADRAAAKIAVMKAASDMPSGDGSGGSGFFANPRGLLYHQGIGARVPWWLGGAALGTLGAGGLLPMAGLGPERLITTPAAIAASAVPAIGGAAAIGAGALGTLAVGGGSDLAVMKSTIADTKTLFDAYTNLQKAVAVYGKGSHQAALAQAELNYQLKSLGPAAQSELALAKQVDSLNTLWDKVTASARGAAVNILDQVVQLGHDYVGKVAQAAFQNLTIINQDIKPLFAWLEGPQGMGIWNNLEQKFKTDLPTAVHAFSMGLELLLRVVNISSQYVGGFLKSIDQHLTYWNSFSDFKLSTIIKHLVEDFRIWWAFIKSAGGAIYQLFHNAAGEGFAVLQVFTQWFNKFDQWAKTVQGSQWLHNFFANRKDELIALIKLLAGFVAGWGKLYIAVQPLVPVFTEVLKIMTGLFNMVNKLAPAFGTALAAYVVFGKYIGFGALNSGLGKLAGVGGGAAVAGRAATSGITAAEAGAGGAAVGLLSKDAVGAAGAEGFGALASDVKMASGFGTAVSGALEGGLVGGIGKMATKLPGLMAKLGPIAKTAALFYIGTGIVTGISQGVQTHGDLWTKVGASITDSVHNLGPTVAPAAAFLGSKLLDGIGGTLLGGAGALFTTFFQNVDSTGVVESSRKLRTEITGDLNTISTDSSWQQVNVQLSEWKARMGEMGPAAGAAMQQMINSIHQFEGSVGSLTAVTPAQATKIVGSFQQIKTAGGSAIQNLYTTVHQNMDNIKSDIGTKSAQGKESLILNFGEAARFMSQNYQAMGVSTTKATSFIDQMIYNASQLGSGYFARFVNNMTGGEKAMLANTNKGMAAVTKVVSSHLLALKQAGISPGQVTTADLTTFIPSTLIHGNPGAARGMLMQVGGAGDHGADTIPMSVGGSNIVVGSGEQVAVFNRYQQAFVNSRLSDVGGLPGMFHKITTPHYMASGGLLPTVQGKATTFGPPGEAAGTTALPGHSSSEAGISLRIPGTHYSDASNRALMGHMFKVTIPGQGHSAVLPDIDLGPADWTGADIDITGAAFPALGIPYSPYWSAASGTAVPIGGTSGIVSSGSGAIAQALGTIVPPKVTGGGAFGDITRGAFKTVVDGANKRLLQIETQLAAAAGPAAATLYTGAGVPFKSGKLTFPLPQGSWSAGAVDQGWDLSAAGDTPEYAVAAGTITGHGIGGFGPWAPVLTLDRPYGPGMSAVYYGHAGPRYELPDGTHVSAGQVLGSVGPGIVGLSTGPHLEIGWYPPGAMGNGASMKSALGYDVGGVVMAAKGAYPHKGHVGTPHKSGGSSSGKKQRKVPTTSSRHPVTHLPHVKHIPGLPGVNPGFSYLYDREAYIEPVIKGWPVHKPTKKEQEQSMIGGEIEKHGGIHIFGHGGQNTYKGVYYQRKPELEPYAKGQGGNAQALIDAQSFMGLLANELSLIQDSDPNTNAPLVNPAYVYNSDWFYPGDPPNPKGYIGAWKIDQQIAGDLGILSMMQGQVGGSRAILQGSLPKYTKGTKHSLHTYLQSVLGDQKAITKLEQQQRADRLKDDPVLKLDEEHRIHDEFTSARAKLHIKEINGKFSASNAYFLAKGVLEQTRSDELRALSAANILDPTAKSIASEGIQGAFSSELTNLNLIRNRTLQTEEVSWAKASLFLSLAEQDALYNIQRNADSLQHKDTVYQIAIDDIRPKMDDAKRKALILWRDLTGADAGALTGHMRKQLVAIGEGSAASPGFGDTDIKHEIINAIASLEDPSSGIPMYKHFIIPQLEQQRKQISGSSSAGAADQTEEIQLLQQLLAFRATDFAVAEQQLRALASFTPVLGQMVGAFAGGTLKGRVVGETGYALVHRDETISPDPQGPFGTQGRGGGSGDVTLSPNIYITLTGGLQSLESYVDARIEKKAPGAVNRTLGPRSRRIANAPGR